MRERLRIFLQLAVFWILFMLAARIVFLLYNHDYSSTLTVGEIFLSLLHGLRMDASISGYFLATNGLLLAISAFVNQSWLSWLIITLNYVLVVVCAILISVDLELYRHWGFRMNTTPLMYIGSEAMGSIQQWVYIKIIVILVTLIFTFLYIFKVKILPRLRYVEAPKHKTKTFFALLGISILMFLPIRGSFSVAPMNTGFVYFHNSKPFANHAAINVVWNFSYSLRSSARSKYPENFFPADQTRKLVSALYESSGSSKKMISAEKPNVILIILESFTADVIEPLGGLKDISPNLNKLCKEGILFSNFYASGDRTDKGLISILSAYPAQPQTSIIKFPGKTLKLPQLNQHLKRLGYNTSFIYGGDIDFANFRSYLNTGGFDHITTVDDFDADLYTSKWGVHDHFMLEKALQNLDASTGPFFHVILTLSSHEPFDVPMETFISGADEESMFLNSCHYTDQSIGKFIDECKTRDWWKNTLVIITADHGHRHPRNKQLNQKERFHIPLLFTGGAVSKDTVVSTIGNQTDIANTLLGQLDKPSADFLFSKDLLNPTSKSFAAYFFNDGYGFVLPNAYVVYDNPGKQFLQNNGATEDDLNVSKAYQQFLFSNYNSLDN